MQHVATTRNHCHINPPPSPITPLLSPPLQKNKRKEETPPINKNKHTHAHTHTTKNNWQNLNLDLTLLKTTSSISELQLLTSTTTEAKPKRSGHRKHSLPCKVVKVQAEELHPWAPPRSLSLCLALHWFFLQHHQAFAMRRRRRRRRGRGASASVSLR